MPAWTDGRRYVTSSSRASSAPLLPTPRRRANEQRARSVSRYGRFDSSVRIPTGTRQRGTREGIRGWGGEPLRAVHVRRGLVDGVELIRSHALPVQAWPRGQLHTCCAVAKLASVVEQGAVIAADVIFVHHVEELLVLCI